MEINTATNILNAFTITGEKGKKKASYTLQEATQLSSSATYNTLAIGFTRSGGTPSAGLLSVKIAEQEQSVETADYTINYNLNGNTIKTVTDNGAVGATITADDVIEVDGVKYLTSAVEAPSLDITSNAANNVLNVDVRKPYTATLKITTTVNGESTTEETVLTETDDKNVSWSYSYPMYKKSGDAYYKSDNDTYVIDGTFADGETIEKTVAYSKADESVVGFSEVGENGKDASLSGGAYTSVNSKLAESALNAGSYQAEIYIVSNGSTGKNTRDEKVVVGDETIATTTRNKFGLQIIPFTITTDGTVVYVQGNGSNNYSDNLDYVIIRKVLSPTVTINPTSKLASYSNSSAVTVPDDVTIYIVKTAPTANTILLESVGTKVIPANTGVILYSATTGEKTLTLGGTADASLFEGNILSGTADGTFTATASTYALKAGEQSFAKVAENVVIPANKAYLTTTSAEAKLNVIFDGTTTGINSIENAAAENNDAPAYNLAGQRVSKSFKGVVIKNGKKFIQK